MSHPDKTSTPDMRTLVGRERSAPVSVSHSRLIALRVLLATAVATAAPIAIAAKLMVLDARGGGRVDLGSVATGLDQAVADIGMGGFQIEAVQMEGGADTLGELAQLGSGDDLAQFRLTHQDQLQQFIRAGIDVGEHP